MRQNFGAKPILYPQPVFIIGSYDEDGKADAMNAAWGGLTEADEITMCISANHKTTENILKRKAFTVSMGTADTVVACDYVRIVSGKDETDKLQVAGFHVTKSAFVDAPVIEELPMTVECALSSYDPDTCRLVGKIVNVCADESVLTDGKIDPAKLRPIVFDGVHHTYHVLGEKVGNAFQDGLTLRK